MRMINLGIVSQTPVIRLLKKYYDAPLKLSDLKEEEYAYTVGGVAPLVKSQLEELEKQRFIKKSTWFSLNPDAPRSIALSDTIKTVSISLEPESRKNYTNFKEKVWNNIHDIKSKEFTSQEFLGYFKYNSKLAEIMLGHYSDIDLFEIHDFQQMLLGSMLGPSAPTILRWHGPFVPEVMSKKIRKFIINGLEGNDAVIVSTKRDLEGLIRAGYRGNAYQVYPHFDESVWNIPSKGRLDKFSAKFGIKADDFLVVNVARMDAIKSQDTLIKAVSLLKDRKVKLMLVGGGSFTSKSLGHPKSDLWLEGLKRLVKRLRMEDRVVFAGSLDHAELECAYKRANLFALPSRMEGFGLVVVESWLFNTPAVVSEGAGASELVTDGFNGYRFKPGDYKHLAHRIQQVYKDDALRVDMGRNARSMARICNVSGAVSQIKKAYLETIENF